MNPTSEVSPASPELVASEMRYRRLFEAARDGILILDGESGRIVDANPFMENLLSYSRADFLGRELWELGFFGDAEESGRAFRELRQNGYIRYEDLPLKTATGEKIEVEFVSNVYLVDDVKVIQCNIRDVSARKRDQEALLQSERLNRNLINHLPHRIVVKDVDSVILYCNANYAKDLGLPPEQIIGKNAFAFHPPELAEAYHADDREVLLLGVAKEVDERYVAAGQEGWVHTVKVPYRDERGEIVGILAVFEDITERKHLEEQLRQSQKMEAIGSLAGGVAHDFNNLLTGILGFCELISMGLDKDDPIAADVEQIRRCGERATGLTRQLLAFSRKQALAVRILDLNALVVELDGMLRRIVDESIEIRTVLGPELGRVKVDPGQIGQVLMNLVINSRDAMPSGGTLTIETANIELDAEFAEAHFASVPGSYVVLTVTDDGCGMDAAVASRIFEPFFTTKEQGKGTGLGLATVYGIVKQSNGSIWCYSEPGHGTSFKIYLPRFDGADARVSLAKLVPPSRGNETVLLAEDDESVRAVIVKILTIEGYVVLMSENGAAALRDYGSPDVAIDLLISDLVMPGMNGYKLMQRMTATRPCLKVLFMSGYTEDAVLRRRTTQDGAFFLPKPFSKDALLRKVREVLDGSPEPKADPILVTA